MAIEVSELRNSRERWKDGSDRGIDTKWKITGSADQDDVLAALEDEAPSSMSSYDRGALRIKPLHIDTEREGMCVWEGTVTYRTSPREEREVGTVRIFMDTTGGSRHVTQALEHIGDYPSGVRSFSGGIGWNGQEYEGTEIEIEVTRFRVEKIYSLSALPDFDTLRAVTKHVNDAMVEIEDTETGKELVAYAGELFLHGCVTGQKRADGGVPVTFDFTSIMNAIYVNIAGITVPFLEGHWHWWVSRVPTTSGGRTVEVPDGVHVEQIAEYADFSDLNI